MRLKNNLSELQAQIGSNELLSSYKIEIANLQHRNLELEQTISNLTADLLNYKK